MQNESRSRNILFICVALAVCLAVVVAFFAGNEAGQDTSKPHMADSPSKTTYDINGDGVVDQADVDCLRKHLIGETPSDFNASAADMDQDGSITAKDVALLQQYIQNTTQSTTQTTAPSTTVTTTTSTTQTTTTSTTKATTTRTYDSTDGWSPILP